MTFRSNSNINYFSIFLVLLFTLFLSSLFVATEIIPLLIVFTLIPVLVFINYTTFKDINYLLILISILTLAVLQFNFSRNLKWILIQDTPLYFLTFFGVFVTLLTAKKDTFSKESLNFAVALVISYSVILFLKGILTNGRNVLAFQEFYQSFYYFLIIPFGAILTSEKQYRIIFSTIFFVIALISIQYFVVNLVSNYRFTTYHNVFVPFLLGYVLLKFLKSRFILHKTIFFIAYLFIWLSSIMTETRLLWITNLITTGAILFFFYMYDSESFKKNTKKIILKIIFTLVLFSVVLGGVLLKSNVFTHESKQSRQRVEDITKPLEDHSFLMRIEISYFAFIEFLKNPVIGSGYGSIVKFHFFGNTKVSFIDNSFLYFLWKGGVIGFGLYFFLFYRFLKISFKILKNTKSKKTKEMIVVIISSFMSFIFYGFFSASLIGYKLNLLYAIIFAYVEFERRKLIDEK